MLTDGWIEAHVSWTGNMMMMFTITYSIHVAGIEASKVSALLRGTQRRIFQLTMQGNEGSSVVFAD